MLKSFVVLAAASVIATSSQAAAADPCQRLAIAVETSLKQIAKIRIEALSDDSAGRETNRQLRYSNELAKVAVSIQLMAQNKCPPRKEPIDDAVYEASALNCVKANEKWRLTDYSSRGPAPAECLMENWKPNDVLVK